MLPTITEPVVMPQADASEHIAWAQIEAQAPVDELAGLLHRTATGCQRSFEQLYRHSSGRLFGLILRINQDYGEAEEVLQETYFKVWHQCQWFESSKGTASCWLLSIARNGAIDSLKRRHHRPKRGWLPTNDEDDDYAWFHSPDVDPLESLMLRRRAAAVQRCLRALPAEQRSSLMLAYYSGFSHEEIAHQLGRPLGTVKTWVRRSLRGLRVSLAAEQ